MKGHNCGIRKYESCGKTRMRCAVRGGKKRHGRTRMMDDTRGTTLIQCEKILHKSDMFEPARENTKRC